MPQQQSWHFVERPAPLQGIGQLRHDQLSVGRHERIDRCDEERCGIGRSRMAAAVVMTLAAAVLVSRVSFDSDILRLLPRKSPAVRSFRMFLESFGSFDHLYVVFEAPGSIGDHTDLVDAYVAALRTAPEIES